MDGTAKSVICIVYVFESRFHISSSVTGKDFNFFFFFFLRQITWT